MNSDNPIWPPGIEAQRREETEQYLWGAAKRCVPANLKTMEWAACLISQEPATKYQRKTRPKHYEDHRKWAIRVAVMVLRHSAINPGVVAVVTARLERAIPKRGRKPRDKASVAEVIPFPSLAERARRRP